MSEEEEKATVVIDFDTIKDQLNQDEELVDNDEAVANDFNLEFGGFDSNPEEDEKYSSKVGVYLFNFKTDYFTTNTMQEYLSNPPKVLSTLDELNGVLSNDPNAIIIFYYNSSPKVVNQLSMQIKNKFPLNKTIIIAKNLSAQKAQQHSQSKYGANSYLNEPFTEDDFIKTIQSLETF